MAAYQVLLYYRYSPIDDPAGYVESHRASCQELGLLGRILVAAEGINGTVSGTVAETERYMENLRDAPETKGIEFKIDPAAGHAFKKLSIRAREELVTLGLPPDENIDPVKLTGTYLSPQDFHEAMQDPRAVILDGRNNFESDLGRFHNAVCPDLEHFRDFPEWIRRNLGGSKNRRILTYCTGGIRCEKLSGFLLREGFADVAQLEGGIVTYGHDPDVQGRDFDGACYVFDQRIRVPVNRENPVTITHCDACRRTVDRYVNCAYPPCNRQFFLCAECEEANGRFCQARCRESQQAAVDTND